HTKTKYDHLTDTTTIECGDLVKWGEAPAELTVQAHIFFRGKESNETAKFYLSLSSNRGGATRQTQPLFQDATTLYLVVDSTRMELSVSDYHHDYFDLASMVA